MASVIAMIHRYRSFPGVMHFIRAWIRYKDRLGSQFGAAIAYFSFLSLIPILMLAFAVVGFLLASHPELLTEIMSKIANSISDPTLANTLKKTINTAVQQRHTVGATGLLIVLYSGIRWIGNLREAIHAQFREVWEQAQPSRKILVTYFWDFLSLLGLMLALIVTLSLSSMAGAAQATIVSILALEHIEFLRPALTIVTLFISMLANYLLFLWIFLSLPRQRVHKSALFRGALLASGGFEVLKFVMTLTLPTLASSPSGAAFGSVLGLMAFFYFFSCLTLFCAAWMATARYDINAEEEAAKKVA